jgi:hypothetical protein
MHASNYEFRSLFTQTTHAEGPQRKFCKFKDVTPVHEHEYLKPSGKLLAGQQSGLCRKICSDATQRKCQK